MTKARILLVEDEPSLVLTLTDRLESEGYSVTAVGDGETAVELGSSGEHDLILLDVALPLKDGFDVCRDLRQKAVHTPILMLTAKSQVLDRVLGLKLGADDYLTKPFEPLELMARIEALLRRAPIGQPSDDGYSFGEITIDFRSARVQRSGVDVELSTLEYKLLKYLVENRGSVLTRDQLLDDVWGYDATPTTRTVDVHISSLRHKIEDTPHAPRRIVTVHGIGYRFDG